MHDAIHRRSMPVRFTSLLAFVALTLAGPLSPSLQGQKAAPPQQWTPQERQKLEASASELLQEGLQAYYQGDLVKAVAKTRESLNVRKRLYAKDSYPQGHPELATSLNTLGGLLLAQGSYREARDYYDRALAMRQSLYPKDRYPQGHSDLANSLTTVGGLLLARGSYSEAREYYERALVMNQSLYPKNPYPQGHPNLVQSLTNLGVVLRIQGASAGAREYLERALAMNELLYPKDRYPQGHSNLVQSLTNLGGMLHNQGSYSEARGYLERALVMNQSLYPKDRFPGGHPELAQSLNSLGALLRAQGSYVEARGYYEPALAMNESLFSTDRYPQGHPDLARSLNNLGGLLQAQGSYGEARSYYERALAMSQSLYPKYRDPQGHPDLAASLNNLGVLLQDHGSYGEARKYHERALAMHQSLYPQASYPQGHPSLAASLNNLGTLLEAQGSYGEAAVLLRQGTDMQQALARTLLAANSEAEAISYLASLPRTRDGLISVSLHVPACDDETYRRIWNGKSALTQFLRDRQAATVGQAGTNPSVRRTVTAWREARSRLARLILATADGRDHPERVAMIKELGTEKERLERELSAAVPEFAQKRALEQSDHRNLLKILPEGTAVLDLLRFTRFEQDPQVKGKVGERRTPGYVGFVLSMGQPVRMVDLGPAQPIEDAVSQWRQAIVHGQDSPAGADLRRLVWEPLARNLPKGTATVYVAPDGALGFILWAALPGDRPGTVLLEQYTLATVPHAPFLLDRLTAPKPSGQEDKDGLFLAVGGVAYSQEPGPVDDERTRLQLLAARPAETKRGGQNGWADLPGTLQELDAVSRLAASREIVRLRGAEAGTARLLQELPRARWAHIATHGCFADPSIRSVLNPDPKLFGRIGTERIGVGLRNPLVLSGLVLAGANRPGSADPLAHDDRGILTAEAIAGLDLSGLELVVLSACETGLGLVGGGEGVFGLQRAFHLAGAQNVVASLWKVNDAATSVLMEQFYTNLWIKKLPKLEALRQAQLTVLNNPGLVTARQAELARRGISEKPEKLPDGGIAATTSPTKERSDPSLWAAFVLSGDGR